MANYTPDHAGIAAYLQTCPELHAELERRAHMGVAAGSALAPRRTGRLAASGHVEDGDLGMTTSHDRMVVSVVFDIDYAAAATWRSPRPDHVHDAYLQAVKAVMEGGGL